MAMLQHTARTSLASLVSSSAARGLIGAISAAASKNATPISLKTLFDFGKNTAPRNLILASNFLQNELPIRLAHRIIELENLPLGLSLTPSVKSLHALYVDSFRLIHEFPRVNSIEKDTEFTEILDGIKQRHSCVVQTMAQGIRELKARTGQKVLGSEIQTFLDRFYLNRMSIRMLIGQHVALHEHSPEQRRERMQRSGFVGIITNDCRPAEVASQAIEHAGFLSDANFGMAPRVELAGDVDLSFTYVPSHLYLMLFELLKNSIRATVEKQRMTRLGVSSSDELAAAFQAMCRPQNASFPRSKFVQAGRIPEWWHEPSAYPPIRLILAQGDEDVTIKISDEGGGIPRSGMPLVWTYSYTTCNDPNGNGTSGTNGVSGSSLFDPSPSRGKDTAKIAGYGFGLPLSRITARYFGGDLVLMPLEGYGMDAYLHLRRLADNQEWLP